MSTRGFRLARRRHACVNIIWHEEFAPLPLASKGAAFFPDMRWSYLKSAVCAVLFFFVLGHSSASFSQELTFTPTFYSMHSALELDMSQQMTEYRQGNQTTKSSTRAWGEKINLSGGGFVYHPRFFVFQANLSEGLSQAHNSDSNTQSGTTTDYELRSKFLPEHPYNLELYTLHNATAAKATFLQGPTDTYDQTGAIFRYQDRPFSFTTSYHANSTNSTANRVIRGPTARTLATREP